MCFFGSSSDDEDDTVASAPASALEAADPVKIGEGRREENLTTFGRDTPQYRVRGSEDDEDYRVDRSSNQISMS